MWKLVLVFQRKAALLIFFCACPGAVPFAKAALHFRLNSQWNQIPHEVAINCSNPILSTASAFSNLIIQSSKFKANIHHPHFYLYLYLEYEQCLIKLNFWILSKMKNMAQNLFRFWVLALVWGRTARPVVHSGVGKLFVTSERFSDKSNWPVTNQKEKEKWQC